MQFRRGTEHVSFSQQCYRSIVKRRTWNILHTYSFFCAIDIFKLCYLFHNLIYVILVSRKQIVEPRSRRFGAGRPIAPYLSLVLRTSYIRIVLFVPLIFLDSDVFSLFEFMLFQLVLVKSFFSRAVRIFLFLSQQQQQHQLAECHH